MCESLSYLLAAGLLRRQTEQHLSGLTQAPVCRLLERRQREPWMRSLQHRPLHEPCLYGQSKGRRRVDGFSRVLRI